MRTVERERAVRVEAVAPAAADHRIAADRIAGRNRLRVRQLRCGPGDVHRALELAVVDVDRNVAVHRRMDRAEVDVHAVERHHTVFVVDDAVHAIERHRIVV